MSEPVFVGIDVSKDQLDVVVRPQRISFSVSNDDSGVFDLVQRLSEISPKAIVLEATGGYERLLIAALGQAGLPLFRMNPRQMRDFAKSTGRLAKTDRIDADALAHFGETIRDEPRVLPPEEVTELASLMSRRRQLVEMIVMEQNRVRLAANNVQKDIRDHISWMKKNLSCLDKDLDGFIQSNPAWNRKLQIIKSVPGVGPSVSRSLLAYLPELGSLSSRKIAALAGLAPFNRDSGRFRGKRSVWGGRAKVRSVLYMAALVGSRHNSVLRVFYQRLLKMGKTKKVALTACMRKLLVIINALVKKNTVWAVNSC